MTCPQTAGAASRTRPLVTAMLAIAAVVSIAPALAQSPPEGSGEVMAIREFELKPGIDTAEFERFVTTKYNPGWEGAVPGMKGYIAKGDRGAQKGSYVLIFIFDSKNTRDRIFPKEGGGASERFTAILEGPLTLGKQLEQYVEPGTLSIYTDYVELR